VIEGIIMKAVIIKADIPLLQYTEVPTPKVGADDLLVKVHAAALNRVDIIQKQAVFTPAEHASPLLGIEVAGEVVEKGTNVTGIKVGDRVFGFVNGGGYAQYCLMDYQFAFPMPIDWNYEYAAAIPEVFITAAERLFTNGDLCFNQSVLIHAGGSGIGTAAIQLAKYVGAKVFITAGSDEKIKKCLELGADVGINYKYNDFVKIVLDETNQQGVDLILDSIGPDYLIRNQQALKCDGRLVLMGVLSGIKGEIDILQLIYKRMTIIGNNLTRRSLESQREVIKRFRNSWLPLLLSKNIKPIIDSVYPIEHIEEAHQRMENNLNFGKIVLKVSHEETNR
jgi:putative PIG3 family NAD(P)H quinone oxidoreductase